MSENGLPYIIILNPLLDYHYPYYNCCVFECFLSIPHHPSKYHCCQVAQITRPWQRWTDMLFFTEHSFPLHKTCCFLIGHLILKPPVHVKRLEMKSKWQPPHASGWHVSSTSRCPWCSLRLGRVNSIRENTRPRRIIIRVPGQEN